MNIEDYKSLLETIEKKVGIVDSALKEYVKESSQWRASNDGRITIIEKDIADFKTMAKTLFKFVVALSVIFNASVSLIALFFKKVIPWLFS